MTTDTTEPTPRAERASNPRPDATTPGHDFNAPSAWSLLGIDPDRQRQDPTLDLAAENARLRQQRDEARGRLAEETVTLQAVVNQRKAAEERYRQLAGEVDEFARKLDRCAAVADASWTISKDGVAHDFRMYADQLRALAATAPTDTPTDTLADWKRRVIAAVWGPPVEAAQVESGSPDGKVGNSATWGWRCQDGCGEFGLNFATEAEVDAAMAVHMAKRHPARVEAGSEAQEGAEAVWHDATYRRLGAELRKRELHWDGDTVLAAVRELDRLRADLVRVTQERDEALRSRDIHQRAVNVAEQKLGEALGYDVAGRYPGMPLLVGQVADERRELLHLRAFAAERDALQATLDATVQDRDNLDIQIRTLALVIVNEVPGEPAGPESAVEVAIRLIRSRRDLLATLDDLRAKVRRITRAVDFVAAGGDATAARIAVDLRALDSVPTQTDTGGESDA